MLTLIIEVWLTVVAWRKGWRGYALLPLAGLFCAGMLIGMSVAATGGKLEDVVGVAVLLELICIGVLIRLAVRGPRTVAAPAPVETILAHDVQRPAA